MMTKTSNAPTADSLIRDLRSLIEEARSSVANTVNMAMTMLYWRIGARINRDILQGERATSGAEILPTLAKKLVSEHGKSFSEKNLRRMIQFAEVFSDEAIVVSLIRQLSWTQYLTELPQREVLEQKLHSVIAQARQRRSLEILDRITEIVPPHKEADLAAALEIIKSEFPTVTDFEREFPSLCFALATGVGKTRLMGAFISYLD